MRSRRSRRRPLLRRPKPAPATNCPYCAYAQQAVASTNTAAIASKLMEASDQLASASTLSVRQLALTGANRASLDALLASLGDDGDARPPSLPACRLLACIAWRWPTESVFAALDAIRLLVLTPGGARHVATLRQLAVRAKAVPGAGPGHLTCGALLARTPPMTALWSGTPLQAAAANAARAPAPWTTCALPVAATAAPTRHHYSCRSRS